MVPDVDQLDRDRSQDTRINRPTRLSERSLAKPSGEHRRLSKPRDQAFVERVAREAKEELEIQVKTWFKKPRQNPFGVRRPKW